MQKGQQGYGTIHGFANNVSTSLNPSTTYIKLVNQTHSRNQFKGTRVIDHTSQKVKGITVKPQLTAIQQEKRPIRSQIASQLQMNPTVNCAEFQRVNRQVREALKIKQSSFQRCIRALLYDQKDIPINDSNLSQVTKQYLSKLNKIIIDLRKYKSELQQIKNYISYVEKAQHYIGVDPNTEWKRVLARSTNDRKAIQECVIGKRTQIQRINIDQHTAKGVYIFNNLSKLSKSLQLEKKMRTQLTIAIQKTVNTTHFFTSSQDLQQQSIDKVQELIKRLSTLKEEHDQYKRKAQELTRQVESSRRNRPSNQPTAIDRHYKLIQELAQLRKAKDVLHDSKNQQISKLKYENAKLQQELKDAEYKKGSNSRIQIKDTGNRQSENEILRQEVNNLKEEMNKMKGQSSSVELALKINIQDYQRQLKIRETCLYRQINDKKSLEETVVKIRTTLAQKQSEIASLNATIVQKDRQISSIKGIQQQKSQQYERMVREKSSLEESLKYQRQRGSAQRKNGDASRQQVIKQRDDLQVNFDRLKEQNRQLATSNQSLQHKRKQLENKLQKMQVSAKNQIPNQLRQNSTELSSLQNLLKKNEKQIAEIRSMSNIKRSNHETGEIQLNRLRSENTQHKQEIKSLNFNLSSKIKELQQLNGENRVIRQTLQEAELNFKQSQSKLTALQKEKTQLASIVSRQERNIKAKDEEIKELMQTNDSLHQMMSEMNDLKINQSFAIEEKTEQSSRKIVQLQDQAHRLAEQIKSSKDNQRQLEADLISKQARISELLSQQQRRESDRSYTIKRIQYQNSQLKSRMREMEQLSRINVDDQARINALYQHELLHNYYQYKLFLTQTLEAHYNRRVQRTRLIFNYDLLNKVNFHLYIDNISSILLIIKTAAGMFIGGYSEGPFVRRSSDRDGLIFSLTNRKYFTLVQPNRRAITYDQYYIIFGNSEIRLKSLENRVFSNFGISNGYYNSRGEKVTVLLGGGQHDRQMDIESYEIYQVFFDDY